MLAPPHRVGHPPEVLKGIAQMRGLPVELGGDARPIDQGIARLEIAVDQDERLALRCRGAQPREDEVQFRVRLELNAAVFALPLGQDRVGGRARRQPQGLVKPGAAPIHRLNRDHQIEKRRCKVDPFGQRAGRVEDHVVASTADPFHHQRRRGEKPAVRICPEHSRCWNGAAFQRLERVILAHPVGLEQSARGIAHEHQAVFVASVRVAPTRVERPVFTRETPGGTNRAIDLQLVHVRNRVTYERGQTRHDLRGQGGAGAVIGDAARR